MTMTEMIPKSRVFKIGATRIVEDASTSGLSAEAVRERLKVNFPEVTHATLRETTLDDGTQVLEWLPAAGRKG
jgi:hypothetical protein